MERDRKDLKIQALLEKISNLTANSENQIAELRIDVTLLSEELEAERAKNVSLTAQINELSAKEEDGIVQETTNSDSSD